MKTIKIDVQGQDFTAIQFNIDEDLQSVLLDSFTRWLTKLFIANANIADGQEIQYGWSIITCHISDSTLKLSMPDGKSLPIVLTDNISDALECIVFHQFVPESFDLSCDIPSMNDTILTSERIGEFPMFMTRSEKITDDDTHTGWFIACSAEDFDISDEDNLTFMSAYEATIKAPHIKKYLSMPCGTQVVFDDATPNFLFRNEPIQPSSNSLVANEQELTTA